MWGGEWWCVCVGGVSGGGGVCVLGGGGRLAKRCSGRMFVSGGGEFGDVRGVGMVTLG